ncbi:hypothetical protein [Olsenella sp. An285]|nr:hypothetical protein [Olsenella sp. An285]
MVWHEAADVRVRGRVCALALLGSRDLMLDDANLLSLPSAR